MIDPKKEDIGRQVVFRDAQGTMTAFDDEWIYVRFGAHGAVPSAVKRDEVDWAGINTKDGVTSGVKFRG